MRYSNRLFLYAPFVALLIIAAIAMFHWRQIANDWESRLLLANNGQEIAPGVSLHFASEEIGGFPFNLDVVLEKCVVALQSTRGPISLASEHFAIHALTYGRAQQILEAAGLQTLTWTDAEGGTHRFVFIPGSLRASAIETEGRLARFDLDLHALRSSSLIAARAQFHIRAAPDRDVLDFVIRGDDLGLQSAHLILPHLNIEGRMMHAAPLSPLLSGHDEWRRAVSDWRMNNGALRVDKMNVDWDASHVTANGVLLLDDGNRISGEMKMQLSGVEQWRPTRLVKSSFTFALEKLTHATLQPHAAALPLTLDVHNGAAIVSTGANSRAAGSIDPVF
ncbi:MAG TPA: DUF2125 domain-containing protein [Rhizomicrobium sp.]|jgi:hypothetical protein|nr:DUF2125 domain-containing protein [Rhizomicrobium sp.]